MSTMLRLVGWAVTLPALFLFASTAIGDPTNDVMLAWSVGALIGSVVWLVLLYAAAEALELLREIARKDVSS